MRALATILALALLGALGLTWRTHSSLQAERLAHQATKADHATAMAAAHAQRAFEEAQRRKTEQELVDAQEAHATEAQALHLDLDRARDRARLESVRVRDAANAAAQRARAGCAAPTTADLRQATGDPIGVLGRVLAEIDDYAGIVAEFADRSRIAGLACEREYDAARQALKD